MREMRDKRNHVVDHTKEALKLLSVLWCCEFYDALYLLGVWMHASCAVLSSEEGDTFPSNLQLLAVEYQSFFLTHIHQVDQVGIMVLIAGPKDHYVIMDTNDTWALLKDGIHP